MTARSFNLVSHSRRFPARPRALGIALALAAFLAPTATCRADLVLTVANANATPGSAGAFDLWIGNTNPLGGASYNVAGDTLELSLSGLSGVTFAGVSISTATPYVFATSGTTQGGGPFSYDTFPNDHFHAADSEFAAAGARVIDPGQSFGLAHVSFAVDAGASPGVRTISFGSDTSFSDAAGTGLAFSTTSGSLTVVSNAVPEPSTLLMTSAGLGFALLFGLLRLTWHGRR